jgi:GMP synthase (glutamine-hydrolysing)
VDSSVCAALLAKAVPGQLHCIFVDHGLMRKNEGDEVEAAFAGRELHFIRVNAEERFLKLLAGVTDPEQKRKLIGGEFVRVFEDEAGKLGDVKFLAQGTIYPDVVESGVNSAVIKSHHNVGGLPGRVIGDITREKLDMLREADAIFRAEMKRSRQKADQYFAVLTDTRSVGVMGDFRTHGYTVALRAVKTTDFMTCQVVPISHAILARIASRIVGEVKGISRVVYDITGKPPATIEWE